MVARGNEITEMHDAYRYRLIRHEKVLVLCLLRGASGSHFFRVGVRAGFFRVYPFFHSIHSLRRFEALSLIQQLVGLFPLASILTNIYILEFRSSQTKIRLEEREFYFHAVNVVAENIAKASCSALSSCATCETCTCRRGAKHYERYGTVKV